MLIKILSAVAAVIAVFLAYVAFKPAHYVIARDITINAPVEKVFPYFNNSKIANSWNPWILEDPEAKIVVSGPDAGVGSTTAWSGGKKLGVGSATIVESRVNERIVIKLDYQKPFAMTQDAFYIFKPLGQQTSVTWKVAGHNNFPCRLMSTVMNMDKMVGDTFSKGLADVKARIEKS